VTVLDSQRAGGGFGLVHSVTAKAVKTSAIGL
jgi:hypothetical protein